MTEPNRSIRLSRGQKIVRNLLLAVLAGFLVWVNAGAPLPPELAFRRVQRENFLTPYAQFLGVCEADAFRWGVGLTDRWLVFGELDSHQLELWPLEGDGPMVIPAPGRYSRGVEELGFVAVNAPEGTAAARLTATSLLLVHPHRDGDPQHHHLLGHPGPGLGGAHPRLLGKRTYTAQEGDPLAARLLSSSACRRARNIRRTQTIELYARGRSGRLEPSIATPSVSGQNPGRPGRRLRPDGGVLRRPGPGAGPGGAHRRRRRVECGRALQKGFPLQGGRCRASRRD